MATIESGLYSKLSGTAGVTTLTSTRIYPRHVPNGQDVDGLDYILYHRISTPRVRDLDGPQAMEYPAFQIDCWSPTALGAKTLADAVRTALDGADGTWGSCTVSDCEVQDEGEIDNLSVGNEEARVYGQRLDIQIWHVEA